MIETALEESRPGSAAADAGDVVENYLRTLKGAVRMNRIEDERIRFYLEHEARIREWAGLEEEVRQFTDRFYRSLQGDLDAALESGEIADDDVESFFDIQAKFWPGLGLRRQDWPKGNEDPDVRLKWSLKWTCFSASANVVCGVRTTVERCRQPFTKEMRPGFPKHNHAWPAYKNVDPPDGRFWEGDNLKKYRDYLVETILRAWHDLAPLVDEAVRSSTQPVPSAA